ncbi:hypothetical protein NE237_006931 [Protea cynaroides]|uniref:Uncharacterized protein n=1 Tax=Protea cynaroides TaxID=273540 RepID=A0A9Q0KNG3_9MAGN|nr:hypothetical protein NE237_006931 [Protea cynaroides]
MVFQHKVVVFQRIPIAHKTVAWFMLNSNGTMLANTVSHMVNSGLKPDGVANSGGYCWKPLLCSRLTVGAGGAATFVGLGEYGALTLAALGFDGLDSVAAELVQFAEIDYEQALLHPSLEVGGY